MWGRSMVVVGTVEVDATDESGVLFERLVVRPISASLGGTRASITLLKSAVLTPILLLNRGLKWPFRCRVLVRVFVGGVGIWSVRGEERVIGWDEWFGFVGA